MRNKIVFILLLFNLTGAAQNDYLPFSAAYLHKHKQYKNRNTEYYTDITLGYVFKPSHQAFKANISLNNLLIHRFGIYNSIEIRPDNFFYISGITATVRSWVYLFGGADLFTKNGLLYKEVPDVRKEVGVGFIPGKWIVIRMGYSTQFGPSLAAGAKIPVGKLLN